MSSVPAPFASVVLPLFESDATLPGCLAALRRQTFDDFELIVTDSSPDDRSRRTIAKLFPKADYAHVPRRLDAHAARNHGARRARGELLVFTNPDSYPHADWLERLVGSVRAGRRVSFGAIACHGVRWFDRGVHLAKFNVCLPGAGSSIAALGWSGNVAVERELFWSLGGWDAEHVQGDTVFGARLAAEGHTLFLDDLAVVDHDHEGVGWAGFLRERYQRGFEYASLEELGLLQARANGRRSKRSRLRLALLPLRVQHRLAHIGLTAWRAGLLFDFCWTLPVVASGVGAWYGGMLVQGLKPREQS